MVGAWNFPPHPWIIYIFKKNTGFTGFTGRVRGIPENANFLYAPSFDINKTTMILSLISVVIRGP